MPETQHDAAAVVGDECHIVSPKLGGPRFQPAFPSNKHDDYPNLILLCKTQHKLVDDQVNTYTVHVLRKLKEKHERWVRDSLSPAKAKAQTASENANVIDHTPAVYGSDDEVVYIRFRCEDGHSSWQQLWEFRAFHEWLKDRRDIERGMAIWGVCPVHGHGTDGVIEDIKIEA